MGAAMLLHAFIRKPGRGEGPLNTVFRADPVDRRHLARYCAAFGFDGGSIPLTYHYLSVQRAHLATMLAGGFPFRIAGMVHVANVLEEFIPLRMDEAYGLHTSIVIEAPADNGARYCECVTEARQHGATVFRCRSRYLARRGAPRPRNGAAAAPGGIRISAWHVGSDAGRRYAVLSGDWNPIHLWGWLARLMGLQRPIVHGMHSLAKACSALQREEGRRIRFLNCRFRSPVPLGTGVAISMQAENGIFWLTCEEKVAVEGSFRN